MNFPRPRTPFRQPETPDFILSDDTKGSLKTENGFSGCLFRAAYCSVPSATM